MEFYKNAKEGKSFNFFFPIAFILSIIPLIVRMAVVNVDTLTSKMWGGETVKTDLFSQRKAFYLMIFSILLVIICIAFFKKIFIKKNKAVNYILISTCVFFVFTLLSAVFSKYKEVSIYGIFDRAEGIITIACYMVLFVYSIYTFRNTKDYKYIITPLFILISINAFLGIFQYVGQDLIKSNLGNIMVIPSEYRTAHSQMSLLNEKGTIYGTLFSYNYVGSFVSIVLPIFFCLTIFEDEIMDKIVLFVGTLLSIWLLFGSTARSGIVGVLGAAIFGIIIFWKPIIKRRKLLLIGFSALLVLVIGANFASKGELFKRVPSLAKDAVSLVSSGGNKDFDYRDHVPVKDIKHTDRDVEVVLQNDTLKISYENGNFVFRNSKDNIVTYTKTDKIYTTTDEDFKNISISIGKADKSSITADALLLRINNQPTFTFKLRDDKTIHLVNPNSREYIDINFPQTLGFNGKEKLGSARGYIWSRSLPLVKENLVFGGGPDTFAFRFPQNDLIGKYYAYDTPNMIVDKAHNLYLQIALNYGVIALLGFLSIMIIYIVNSIKLYAFKEYYEKPQILGAVTSLGIVGYLFAGMFNDSVVSVAPVFWIILGVGVALNYMNRQES